MVKFAHKRTGVTLWVAENRVDEMLAAGHKPAAGFVVEPETPTEEKPKPKRKRAAKKKTEE